MTITGSAITTVLALTAALVKLSLETGKLPGGEYLDLCSLSLGNFCSPPCVLKTLFPQGLVTPCISHSVAQCEGVRREGGRAGFHF